MLKKTSWKKIPSNEDWSFLLQKTTSSILTSHSLSYCSTLALGLKRLLCKRDIEPQNENTSRGAAHTPVPSRHIKSQTGWPDSSPTSIHCFYPKWFSSVQCRVTQFFSTVIEGCQNKSSHKATRSLLLFGSLIFCSAHIRERQCEMLTMSTATSTAHCLNTSSSFSRDFRTERLWLDLLCYSQTPWQPCSQAAQTAALVPQLLEGHFGDM